MKPRAWILLLVVTVVAIMVAAGAGIASLLNSGFDQQASGIAAPTSGAPTMEDDEFGTIEVYRITDDARLEPEASGLTAEIWSTFVRVATPEFSSSTISQFRVGDAPKSDTLAYVFQDSDPQKWMLAANLATSENRQDLIATLVHEYGHILTLGTDQVNPDYGSCHTIELDEGCANPGSAIEAFTARFWTPYGDAAPTLDNTDSDVAYAFYLDNDDDFVSDYAATNAVEDIAETFMTWVVQDDPAAGSVIAEKFAFLEGYPLLVDERARIRTEFADELGLAA